MEKEKGNVWDSHSLDKDFEEFFKKFKNPKDYSVIDLGCGNGSQAYFLEQMGFNVTGTDIRNYLEYFIGNFIIDDSLNSRLNKKYDFIVDKGLIHNLINDNRRDNYFDMIENISDDQTVILLKVLSPYEIRCSPFFDHPNGPYRFTDEELEYLYYDLGFKCNLIKDTFFYSIEKPYLRGNFCLYSRD